MTTTTKRANRGAKAAVDQASVDLMLAISPRRTTAEVAADIRRLRAQHRELRDRYRGGLAAETQSCDAALADVGLYSPRSGYHQRAGYTIRVGRSKRPAIRKAWLSRLGRRIDLVALLNQQRPDGSPAWAVVDPRRPIDWRNGGRWVGGSVGSLMYVAGSGIDPYGLRSYSQLQVPSGMPPIPQRVRDMLADTKIASRAKWIGVLYQPESWREANPDPALVVEWADVRGEYYALAVWGGDRAAIMEWVD